MVDRVIKLKQIPTKNIVRGGFDWYLGQEYLVPEAIILTPEEIEKFIAVADEAYHLYAKVTDIIIANAEWDKFNFPVAMREMIQHSWDRRDVHLLGRFDLSGGIDNLPINVFELNADTPTMLPETVVFQNLFKNETRNNNYNQYNDLRIELKETFMSMLKDFPHRNNSLLVTSLGHEEDVLNAQVIVEIAKEAGFNAVYADLEDIVFEEDGVYVDFDDNSDQKFDYLYKIVPWEFIMYEEPELLELLRDLQIRDKVYIMNPAYTAIMQSKAILPYLFANFEADFILKSTFNKKDFEGESYVKKVVFGRLGENIKIVDKFGSKIAQTEGDYANFSNIFQAFSPLFQDKEGAYYQPGIYMVDGKSAGISFRRCENIIVNDDAEFIPHFINEA